LSDRDCAALTVDARRRKRTARGPQASGRIDVRSALLTIAAVMAVFVLPGSASAATCSDYATQAEAQRAADTRDADGDGI
jgi:hypothetical protein